MKMLQILLVEDSPGDMFLARRALVCSPMEIDLTVAQTGQEAITHIERRSFDLVLLDINLWDMSGFDVLEQMNQQPNLHSSPAFVLSTSRDPVDRERANSLGAIGYASKPRSYADYAQLIGTVEKLLVTLDSTAIKSV